MTDALKPPIVASSTRMFTGKVFDVDRDRLRFDDGREVDVDIVRHRASVVMIPVTGAGEIILVRQYRHAIARWIWELPAGTTEPGEDPAAAAARECHEEVGMVPGRVTRLGSMFPTPGFCDEEMIFYLLEDLRAPEAGRSLSSGLHDPDEQLEPGAFTLDDLDALAAGGERSDMKTIAGLELLRRAR
jgi:ADP-ribose pyrophosphatase